MNDELGDRMKEYEAPRSAERFMPLLPICARIDGKCFSNFTRSLDKPYDIQLIKLMQDTTRYLVEETQSCIGYTQSDEISLIWYSPNSKSQVFFDGKVQKMVSILSSMATAYFNEKIPLYLPTKVHHRALFDCRVWQVPTCEEAANNILWRELDATKNSISMATRCYYSPKEMHKKTSKEMQDMLMEQGINWNDYPACFKRGTFVQKHKIMRKFTTTEIRFLKMPPFLKVLNRMGVIFKGAEPISFAMDKGE